MKILLFFLILLQNQALIGRESIQCEQIRYYVSAENLSTCEDGIIVSHAESLILVQNLFHDERGFYFYDIDECGWICSWCGTINPLDFIACKRCGEAYGSRPPKKR